MRRPSCIFPEGNDTMDREFFANQQRAVAAAYARGLGCEPEAFAQERLTIVDRPADATWPYTTAAVTFGTGTVLSVDPEYRAFAEEHAPAKHFRVMYAVLMQRLVDEGARRGITLAYQTPMLGFALGAAPAAREPLPAGFRIETVDTDWMNAEMPSGRFHNGLGDPPDGYSENRRTRNRFACVAFDDRGEPAAVAGVFTSFGLFEIGIDVLREHRGLGLARDAVSAAAAEVLRRGETPFYACAATNIRSQRTAAACGFVPVLSDAWVFPDRMAAEPTEAAT